MPKFTVYGRVEISCYTYVEADSEEEAKRIANERGTAGLTHNACSDDGSTEWVIDEIDGAPAVIGADEN